MPIVQGVEKLFSITATKRFGKHRFLGSSIFGFSNFGIDDTKVKIGNDKEIVLTGIYALKHLNGKRFYARHNYYLPYNPRTEIQQSNRLTFKNAVIAWQGLTENERLLYNKRAKNKNYSGYNLFISEYMFFH